MNIIVTDDEIEELPLPSLEGLSEGRIIEPKKLGRTEGKKVPQLDKELIVINSNMGMNQPDLAKIFDVSQAEVSILERGLDRTNIDTRKVNEPLRALGEESKQRALGIAEARLLKSLEIYNPEALEQKELPGAASKLASVIDKLAGNRESGTNIQFVVMQPRQRSEEDFETIQLNER